MRWETDELLLLLLEYTSATVPVGRRLGETRNVVSEDDVLHAV